MARYIVLPKEDSIATSVSMASRKMSEANRRKQVEEIREVRRSSHVQKEIDRWISDRIGVRPRRTRAQSQSRPREGEVIRAEILPLTGASIVEMGEDLAETMRADLREVTLIADRPVELIRPSEASATPRKKLGKTDRWHREAIGLPSRNSTSKSQKTPTITVAVLDTGVDASHPELAGKVRAAQSFDLNSALGEMDPSVDTQGHGTHVAGLICGNTIGVASNTEIVSGVIIPKGIGRLSGFLMGLEWAGQNPSVDIVNISAGFPGFDPALREAMRGIVAAGVLPVVAVGNEGRNQTRSPGNYVDVLSVGAVNRELRVSRFSGGGSLLVDYHQYSVPQVVAPGEGVYSCVMGGGYEAWNGTSMAAPIVSGVAARILQIAGDMSVVELREEIISRCKVLADAPDRQGHGLVQLGADR